MSDADKVNKIKEIALHSYNIIFNDPEENSQTQCKICGKGGVKTVTLKHRFKLEWELEVGAECLLLALFQLLN